MRNILRSLKKVKLINYSIRTKLLLIYLLCVLIPIIIFSFAFYSSAMKSTKNEKLVLFEQALNRIGSSIGANAVSAMELSNIIYPDETMYRYLNKEYGSRQECLDDYNNYLKDAWNKILPYNTKIVLFSVYTNNDTLLNGKHLQRIDDRVEKNDWYGKYENESAKALFINHTDEVIVGSASSKLVSYIRKLDYLSSIKYKHFLKITFQADMFDKILKSESLPGNIYIVNKENNIISQSNKEEDVYSSTEFISFNSVKTAAGQIVLQTPIQTMDGWRVICVLEKNFMGNAFGVNWIQIFILIFSTTIFASIIIWAISTSLYKRIDVLVKHMGEVEKGNYVLISENEKGNDEIGLMITSMNSMISKISILIEDVYKAKIKETQMELLKKQSELNALQCQVNPHFMFNVLETIRIKAYLKNEFETARIIKYMSKIFRKLLLWNNDLIELSEELKFIKEYLEIQQYRYEDELDFQITAEESLLKLKMPKMTLQTFVDNACEHGFSETKGLKRVKININLFGNKVELRVFDNGKGMSPEMISNINHLESKGIGIKNVIGRLSLYYKDNYNFRINSILKEFTEIVLTLDLEELRRCDYV